MICSHMWCHGRLCAKPWAAVGICSGAHHAFTSCTVHAAWLVQFVSRLNHMGGCLDMHACFLLQRGLKTLPLRVRQQSANALALAQFLEKQPQVRIIKGLTTTLCSGMAALRCCLCSAVRIPCSILVLRVHIVI